MTSRNCRSCEPRGICLLQFFLYTGARDQEVQAATWNNISFQGKTFSVTEKLNLAFVPKCKE